MNEATGAETNGAAPEEAISFAGRLVGSEGFKSLFQEGMGLIEETAGYLDGPGREASRNLSRTASLAYATESMRLTTRLMQVASWLLLQRAVHEGEMSAEQARSEKYRVRLETLSASREGAGFSELPGPLKDLVGRSVRLQERVRHLDGLFHQSAPQEAEANEVANRIDRLRAAFGQN